LGLEQGGVGDEPEFAPERDDCATGPDVEVTSGNLIADGRVDLARCPNGE